MHPTHMTRSFGGSHFLFLLLIMGAAFYFSPFLVAQDSIADAPSIEIVAPFDGDEVERSVIIITKTEETTVEITMEVTTEDGSVVHEETLSTESNGSWDSTQQPDGEYTLEVEACNQRECSMENVRVRVQNEKAKERASTRKWETTLPFREDEKYYWIKPFNRVGAFYLNPSPSNGKEPRVSTGEPLRAPLGTYEGKLTLFETPFKEVRGTFTLDHNGYFAQIKKQSNSTSASIRLREGLNRAEEITVLSFDYHGEYEIDILPPADAITYFCATFQTRDQTCLSEWDENPPTLIPISKKTSSLEAGIFFVRSDPPGILPLGTTTDVKTVAFFAGQRESATDLAENTYVYFPDFNVYLPENDVNVVSAWVEAQIYSTFSSTTGTTNVIDVDVNVNGTIYAPITSAYTLDSAEPEPFMVRADVTSQFASFSNPKLFNVGIKVDSSSTNHRTNAHALVLYVTYQYDPTSSTQIRTVKFPLDSRTPERADNSITPFTYNASIPEAATVRSRWFELSGFFRQTSTVDTNIMAAVDGDALSTGAFYDMAWTDSLDAFYYFSPSSSSSFAINTNQTLNVKNGHPIQHLGGELVVTYEYANSEATQLKTVQYFMGLAGLKDDATARTWSQIISLPEDDVNVTEVWATIKGGFDSTTAGTHAIGGKIGSTNVPIQAFVVDNSGEMISNYKFFYDLNVAKAALVDGVQVDINSDYSGTQGSNTASAASGILNITYRYASASTQKQNTLQFFAGQSTGTATSHTFSSVKTYTATSAFANTRKSAFIDNSITQVSTAEPIVITTINALSDQNANHSNSGEPTYFTDFMGDVNAVVTADTNTYSIVCSISNATSGCSMKLFLTYVVDSSDASEDYSFVLLLPSSGCTTGKGNITGGTNCQKIYFEATELDGPTDENQINPEGQTSSIPFLVYDNQSSASNDLNIFLDVNQSLPATHVLKVSKSYAGYSGLCSGVPDTNCKLVTTTASSFGKATYSTGTQDLNLFIWTDFVSGSVGQLDLNLDSNGAAST